jgi:sulfatase modifying factor 1
VPRRAILALLAPGALVLATGAKPGDPPRDASTEERDPAPSAPGADSGDQPEPPLASTAAAPSPRRRASPTGVSGPCPRDMVLVEGDECAEVSQPCLEWLPEPTGEKMRCARFAPSRCVGKRTPARFCIDRYEYPDVKGKIPVVMKTWTQASSLCGARGRRLCKGGEWTLACEGEERLPYPYGYVRDAEACNMDRPLSGPYPRWLEHAPRGIDVSLVDWRAPSGEMEACTSPFGVHDMTGNVDEWVVNEGGHPYASGLKGGYWGPVRDRCRPMTVAHDEQFAFYQIGFRCCEDVPRASGR